ncbi:MAG: hypothetical protein ABJH04_07735 [Cyclobacteriaceae bacterium]
MENQNLLTKPVDGKHYFKAIIRVIKSLNSGSNSFGPVEVLREKIVEAKDKSEVKMILADKYPQFFPNNRVYEKETKDSAQFFYVVIFPLSNWELNQISEGEWRCSHCGQVHENKYVSRPKTNNRVFGDDILFCSSEDDVCYQGYIKEIYKLEEFPDDLNFIKSDSPNYIYKCTEKSSGKCYVGKTRNAPFFRWWNHLSHSQSPFGVYLRQTKLSDWTFEVLEELPANIPEKEIFRIESEYISKFNSIHNGFNSVVSYQRPGLDRSNTLSLDFDNSI